MGSAALLALFGVWHTQSELHAMNDLCSVCLPSLANFTISLLCLPWRCTVCCAKQLFWASCPWYCCGSSGIAFPRPFQGPEKTYTDVHGDHGAKVFARFLFWRVQHDIG